MSMVSPTAAAQHIQARRWSAQAPVPVGKVKQVAAVELRHYVQFGMSER